MTGLDPMPRTFREMVWARNGHEYAEWERLSVLLALVRNVNRGPHDRAVMPSAFFQRPGKEAPRGTPLTPGAFRAMKSLFVKKRQ